MTISPIEFLLAGLAAALVIALAALLRGRGGRGPGVETGLERLDRALSAEMAQSRQETAATLKAFGDSLNQRVDALSLALERRVERLAAESGARLEEMRRTVDEKLQGTLEQRLGESFRQVSERLEQVHRGLGEMQTLAAGVGDLKRVLGNVKARGTWGEMQLAQLLEQVLTADQYRANVPTLPGSAERVEFAIRLPGSEAGAEVLLPIDAKFPREDYERLIEAADRADAEAVETAARALETRLKASARDIRDKYLHPPHTTDFAVMFLPTEGLYAEALRRPGLIDQLQREYRVVPAGPTTLAALLNSLQMGFRTLAIEKRSSEVWQLLGAVKSEFAKYGDVLDKVQKKLAEASNQIEQVAVRRRAMDRKLRQVESLEPTEAARLIDAAPSDELE